MMRFDLLGNREDAGQRFLVGLCVAVLLSAALWLPVAAALDWIRAHPAATAKLWAGSALLLGSWAVFEGLARSERRRGRRDSGRVSRSWLRRERRDGV